MTHTNRHDITWTRHPKNGVGSANRMTRGYFAFLVTMAATGGRMVCPSCEGSLDMRTAEVDRVVPRNDADGSKHYDAGTGLVYICRACNESRGTLQSVGRDWPRVNEYAAMVNAAADTVTMPTPGEAKAWWPTRHNTAARVSRFA